MQSMVSVGLAALAMGALNARGRFFAPALGPAILNVGMIAGVLSLYDVGPLEDVRLELAVNMDDVEPVAAGSGVLARRLQAEKARPLGDIIDPDGH